MSDQTTTFRNRFAKTLATASLLAPLNTGCSPSDSGSTSPAVTSTENGSQTVSEVTGELHHKGDLIVTGNIRKGAKLYIEDGGLIVRGNVEDDAFIDQRGGISVNSGITVSGNNITSVVVSGKNSRVIINGVDVTEAAQKGQNGVPLSQISGVKIEGSVGERAEIHSSNTLEAGDIGESAILKAGNSIDVLNVGKGAELDAGNSITAQKIAGATLFSGNSIIVTTVDRDASLDAGNSINATAIEKGANVHAGNSINAPGYKDGRRAR